MLICSLEGEEISDNNSLLISTDYYKLSDGKSINLYCVNDERFLRLVEQISILRVECDALSIELNLEDEKSAIQKLINDLHEYNEIKDVVQYMMGILANLDACTTRQIYSKYNLNIED